MAAETFPPILQAMIDRASELSAEDTKALGDYWESDEGWQLPVVPWYEQLFGYLEIPAMTNRRLQKAWQDALEAAGNAGRANEIDAARAAGRAAVRADRKFHDTEAEENGAEQAVRAAVLALGVHDLISPTDYITLVGPWQKVLGTTLVVHPAARD